MPNEAVCFTPSFVQSTDPQLSNNFRSAPRSGNAATDRNTWEPKENLLLASIQKRAEEVKVKAVEHHRRTGLRGTLVERGGRGTF